MIAQFAHGLPLLVLAGAGVGYALGAIYFASVRITAARFASGAAAHVIVVKSLLRIAAAVVVFAALASLHAFAAIAGMAGFIVARQRSLAPE